MELKDDELKELFRKESLRKKSSYVHINETVVQDSSHVIHIDLGSCASVVLCGINERRDTWVGVNHLFKSREQNDDVALQHVASLIHSLEEKGATEIQCLGLFGAGYREKSLAREVAQKNIRTTLEALALFDLTIEIFQTGFSQGISVLRSDSRDSFLVQHKNIESKETRVIEVPLKHIFKRIR